MHYQPFWDLLACYEEVLTYPWNLVNNKTPHFLKI